MPRYKVKSFHTVAIETVEEADSEEEAFDSHYIAVVDEVLTSPHIVWSSNGVSNTEINMLEESPGSNR